MYLKFSEPMSEGRSSQYVQLFDDISGDTVKNAFLDLQPELWNEDGTALTLWLDPGRIKQDLIPNRNLGVVMNDNHRYRLVVAKGWKARNGLGLENDFSRTFTTLKRDVTKPDVNNWKINVLGNKVIIHMEESLDWSLVHSVISVTYNDQEIVPETFVDKCEDHVYLTFPNQLSPGEYSLNIESRLEDLAGNSLNRLFETDVTAPSNNSPTKDVYTRRFTVK
jgi:hypothetical protein